jgi:pentatricopeptide repeat protein
VHYAAAFHRLRELKQWRRALSVMEQLKNDSTVWADCAAAAGSSVDDADARADADARQAASDPAFAWALECRTKVRHLHNEALAGCAKAGLWETAFDLLEGMRERSRSSSRRWTNGSRGNGLPDANGGGGEDWSWMEPDARNYTAALTACAKAPGYGATAKSQAGRKKSVTSAPWEAALGLMSVMEERRDPLDQYAYHAAICT